MVRTLQNVFTAHIRAIGAQDPHAVSANYAETAVLLTPAGVFSGRDAVRQASADMFAALPDAVWETKSCAFYADMVLVNWSAKSTHGVIDDGVSTFVIADGLIHKQTDHYTVLMEAPPTHAFLFRRD